MHIIPPNLNEKIFTTFLNNINDLNKKISAIPGGEIHICTGKDRNESWHDYLARYSIAYKQVRSILLESMRDDLAKEDSDRLVLLIGELGVLSAKGITAEEWLAELEKKKKQAQAQISAVDSSSSGAVTRPPAPVPAAMPVAEKVSQTPRKPSIYGNAKEAFKKRLSGFRDLTPSQPPAPAIPASHTPAEKHLLDATQAFGLGGSGLGRSKSENFPTIKPRVRATLSKDQLATASASSTSGQTLFSGRLADASRDTAPPAVRTKKPELPADDAASKKPELQNSASLTSSASPPASLLTGSPMADDSELSTTVLPPATSPPAGKEMINSVGYTFLNEKPVDRPATPQARLQAFNGERPPSPLQKIAEQDGEQLSSSAPRPQ